MDKKYQIFISSTYKDLISEREKVRDVILSMYQFPIGMEMFSAGDEDQWEIIKETIDSSDYYILIIGKRYGSVITDGSDKGMSYTEKEYHYAKSIGIPILAYIKDETTITANKVDTDADQVAKLKTFVDDVAKGREVKWFSSIDQLGTEVTLSLHKEMDRKRRPGWIRSDSVNIEKSLSEIVELSRQNRELQEENKRLSVELESLKALSKRRPLLAVLLETTKPDDDERHLELYQHGDFMTVDDEGTVHLKLEKISTNLQEAEYQPISKADFPPDLKKHVSEQEIREYNAALPPRDELQSYLNAYKHYLRLKKNGVATTFYIHNFGMAKATDVSVTIEFPDEVKVFDIGEVTDMDEPTAPEKPEDLFQKTYAKAHTGEMAFYKAFSQMNAFDHLDRSLALSSMLVPSYVSQNSIYESIDIEDNIVEIEQKRGIVHTKFDRFSGAYIVPVIPGEYEAKVTLMCAEYEEPEETTIRFAVEE